MGGIGSAYCSKRKVHADIPNFEPHLNSVRDEAIIIGLGLDIRNAINENSIRRRELQEGKHVTERGSMILTKTGLSSTYPSV